tara:strand:+ start:243 stop:428 length:186 start_codon:yes stop_codon:yes gene_type:complete
MLKQMFYFVIVKFNDGKIKIWKDYHSDTIWGSPLYEVLGYADTFNEAKEIKRRELNKCLIK